MRNAPESSDFLEATDLLRYQNILRGILDRRCMVDPPDPNVGTVYFQEKIGVITLKNGIYEMYIDGLGIAKIFPDGSVEGDYQGFAQWFVTADGEPDQYGSVFEGIRKTALGAQDTLKDK